MREIKCRVWDTDAKTMLMPERHRWYSPYRGIIHELRDVPQENGCYLTTFVRCFNGEVMQFCGLTDKNGVEIYESDILKSSGTQKANVVTGEVKDTPWWNIGTVEFINGSFVPKIVLQENSWFGDLPHVSRFFVQDGVCPQMEVIGNLHQHPELLTK